MPYFELSLTSEQIEAALIRGLNACTVTFLETPPITPNENDLNIVPSTGTIYLYDGDGWVPIITTVAEEVVIQASPPSSGKIWVDSNMHLHVWNATNAVWVQV